MIIKRCEEKDFLLLKSIFKRVYSTNSLLQKKDYFDWQFKKHPLNEDDCYTLWILWDDSKIIGFYGWVPVELVCNGSIRMGCEPIHWWAEKGSKSGGLNLLDKIMSDYPIRLYHDCNDNSVKIFRVYGMPLFSLPKLLYIRDVEKVCSLFKIRNERSLKKQLEGTRFSRDRNRTFPEIHSLDRVNEEEEMLFRNWPTIKSHIRYTGRYLNWRYFDIPYHDYRVIASDKKGEYGVYRIEKIAGTDVSVIRIMEWSFGHDSSRKAMIFLDNEGAKENAILMDYFCSSNEMGLTLEKCGFISARTSPFNTIPRLFRPVCMATDMISCIDVPPYRSKSTVNFNQWYISKGNSDMDRKKN